MFKREFKGQFFSTEVTEDARLVRITLHDAAAETSLADAAGASYWFCYSVLGTGPSISSQGAVRNEDGSITTTYRV